MLSSGRVTVGGGILLFIVLCCLMTLPFTLNEKGKLYYDKQQPELARARAIWVPKPADEPAATTAALAKAGVAGMFGYDNLGRSIFGRCLLGGTISLAVGGAAAAIAVVLGVGVGLVAGYKGGLTDSTLMRSVDVLYGLPYVLLVILFKIAFEPVLGQFLSSQTANLVVLFSAIGLVSWLTMSRVVRGQVLSLRNQPFVEAARAMGLPSSRIFFVHILPNLIGPITVYATLTVPAAILQESFLSFLGIGITPPMPTWGSLASDAVTSLSPVRFYWWMLLFPCILLVVTLLSLNFVGDGLRDIFDPKQREAAKI
jgi:oligopeptide transport system permease protein